MKLTKINIITIVLVLLSGCSTTERIQNHSKQVLSKEVTNAIGLCSAGYASADAGVLSAQLISSGANIKGELNKIEKGALDLSNPEMYKQYLTCVQDYLGNITTQKIPSSNAVGTLTTKPKLSGAWDFQLVASASVDKSGRKRSINDQVEIRINLIENNGLISGQYVWGTKNSCTSARISGKQLGESIDFVVTYTGACCRGAKMKFNGILSSSMNLTGKFQPEGLPPVSSCNIWWADVIAIKSV